MAISSGNQLTRYISAVTIVTADVANSWYGGLFGTSEGNLLDPSDPLVAGHVHDGTHADGHAQKIDLVNHVTGQLRNDNLADNAVNVRNVQSFLDPANAIPISEIVGGSEFFYLDLSSFTISLQDAYNAGNTIDIPDGAAAPVIITNDDVTNTESALDIIHNVEGIAAPGLRVEAAVGEGVAAAFGVTDIGLSGTTVATLADGRFTDGANGGSSAGFFSRGRIAAETDQAVVYISQLGAIDDQPALRVTTVAAADAAEFNGDVTVNGKLTVTGLIDPTGLVVTHQPSAPATPTAGEGQFWADTGDTPFYTTSGGTDIPLDGGSETLAETLALGNVTGGNAIVVEDNDNIEFGTGSDFAVSFDPTGVGLLTIDGVSITAAGASLGTAAFGITTGDRIVDDPTTGPNSGNLGLDTGGTSSLDGSGTGGDTGSLVFTTGNATAGAGTSGSSGDITLTTGDSDSLDSGDIILTAGTAAGTRGIVDLNSRAVRATIEEDSGAVQIIEGSNNVTYLELDATAANRKLTYGFEPQATSDYRPTLQIEAHTAFKHDGANFSTRRVLEQNFEQLPQTTGSYSATTNKHFGIFGNSISNSHADLTEGYLTLYQLGLLTHNATVTAATFNLGGSDNAIWAGGPSATSPVWASTQEVSYKAVLRTGDNHTDVRYECGIRSTPLAMETGGGDPEVASTNTDTDKIVIYFDPNVGTDWRLLTSNNNTHTKSGTGVTVTTNTFYEIEVIVDADENVTVIINDIVVINSGHSLFATRTYLGVPYAGVLLQNESATVKLGVIKMGVAANL